MSEKVEGIARAMGGRVQEAVGDLTGNNRMQARGVYNQAAGEAQERVAQLSELVRDRPLAAIVVALGVGYILGRLI